MQKDLQLNKIMKSVQEFETANRTVHGKYCGGGDVVKAIRRNANMGR